MSKIASIASSDYKYKRKSNEEQYKVNKKVLEKIDDCDRNLTSSKVQEAKENLAEASRVLKQRQKVIRIDDESDMGWKVVDEYIQSEVASDEEDQKRIHRAQSRAAHHSKVRVDLKRVSTDKSSVSPYRLKNCKDKWEQAGSDPYIMSVIEEGYKIPFKEIPSTKRSNNNKSARDNPEFVTAELKKMLSKKCIYKVETEPHVINPLTVAYNKKGKPRLVLDCRNINDNLHKFKLNRKAMFKYEDLQVARQLFEKGFYMFLFDIRGAYNHIDIFQPHRTFLGFSWPGRGKEAYYVYNSLPFGLASAGNIFCKDLKVLVTFWHSKGHRVVTFLGDGLGGNQNYNTACASSEFVKQSLMEFGFLISEEKCQWQPALQISWLGYIFCMKAGRFFC